MSKHGAQMRKRRHFPFLISKPEDGQYDTNIVKYPSWYGCLRLLACAINTCLILGIYLEYLWAADWPEIHPRCNHRSSLPWLDFADCFHRYTFSDSMLRGQNLTTFGIVGTHVAFCFLLVEYKRTQHIQSLLQAALYKINAAATDEEARTGLTFTLRSLPMYFAMMCSAFISVLFLVPFNLERPCLHYACAGLAAGSMLLGMCTYVAIPFDTIIGLSSTSPMEQSSVIIDLRLWARQHQMLRKFVWFPIALHFILPATVALHHLLWIDLTGRIFGACEVLTILSYQFFVALFAFDDFSMQSNPQQSPSAAKGTANPKFIETLLFRMLHA